MRISVPGQRLQRARYVVEIASQAQREAIYRMRHAIYATELKQHAENSAGLLSDGLDQRNVYVVGTVAGKVAGFISITQPGGFYSIEKYFPREAVELPWDGAVYELRLLSVLAPHRGRSLALLLMYAAFRWVEAHSGTHVVALGRDEVLDLYLQLGLRATGDTVQSGAVSYHLLFERVAGIRAAIAGRQALIRRLEGATRWRLPIPFAAAPACYHGGAFFHAIGEEFDHLERSKEVINADVLDAWFPPSPRVMTALQDNLSWLVRTSPPTNCAGLVRTIARVRDVDARCVLPGAGSSDLIFRALTRWLSPASRVLILDPMYGEYAHLLQTVIRCCVDRFRLERECGYLPKPEALLDRLHRGRYDLAILVNPNSPTGRYLRRATLERLLEAVPHTTRVWIDETYIDYAGDGESVERFAAASQNVIVCKSMSKSYALSGLRVGYLCAPPAIVEELRAYTPPWVVGLPAQVAAVNALDDAPYYRGRWQETHVLRAELARGLKKSVGLDVLPGIANFLLCQLPEHGPDARTLVAKAQTHGCFLRDAGLMGTRLGSRAVRVAVKDAETNQRIIDILSGILSGGFGPGLSDTVGVSSRSQLPGEAHHVNPG